jgi:hypothetical protein
MTEGRVFAVPLECPSNTVLSDSAWLFTSTYADGGASTVVLDLEEWPPTLAKHELPEYTLCAASGPRGELLVFASPHANPPRKWLLRRYARATDPKPSHEEAPPFALPELSAMLAALNDTDRYIESGQTHPVDALCFVGEHAVLVPRHVGIASFHPWLADKGSWKELTELPRFVKSVDDVRGRPGVASVRLGDGADVLVWNRHAFEWNGRSFVRSFEHEVPLDWTDDSPLVPSGSAGFFCLASGGLLEVRRGSEPPRKHLEGMYVSALRPGPNGTLLVDRSDGWALYDPAGDTLADLSELTAGARDVVWSRGGYLIVARGTFGAELHRVSRAALDGAVKSTVTAVIEAAEQAKQRTEADALDCDRSRSRPRLAVEGERLFTLFQSSLQQHDFDVHRSRLELETELLALAVSTERAACLDAAGVLRLIDLGAGKTLCREQVTGRPRSLVGSGATLFAVLGADWTTLVGDRVYAEDSRIPRLERRSVAFEGGLAGCFTSDGASLVLTGEHRTAVRVDPTTGVVEPLPAPAETIHALASAGTGRCIGLGLTGLHALELDTREWSRLEGEAKLVTPGNHLAVSPSGKWLAVESTDRQVEVLALPELKSVISVGYPDSFQTGGSLEVVGLAFLDESRLAIGLSGGNANIIEIDQKSACRTDAPAGEQNARWVFFLNGSILIAE